MKQFKTESKRVLDLMINSIYTNKEIFLRELLSNASDAIDKLKFISLTDSKVITDFKIKITIDKEDRALIIEDNGIGMTDKDLEKHLGTIAESGTLAFKKQNEGKDNELIGQFGVGFYSAFMVADEIKVYSRAYGANTAFLWTSCGVEGYEITETEKESVGTKIVLKIKEDSDEFKYSDFLDSFKISNLVKKYSDYIRYPINMDMERSVKKEGTPDDKPEYERVVEEETLNSMIPLWKKNKTEVSDKDLSEFYKAEFHDYIDPLKSMYAKIEGTITYDTLLFVPAKAPYDYFSKDYKRGVKLYSNGVLIMENCEDLIPDYLGFIKGIVDSPDLSLNISREILQQDRQVKSIAQSLEKKIVAELKKMMDTDPDGYEKMFKEFGLSIKFGVYQGFGMKKDLLQDLLMFYSSKKEKLVSLNTYVSEMTDDDKEIYYASGESYEKIGALPQVEKFKESGKEVLYFKDGVDEFVAKILISYKDKKFVSVQEAVINDSKEDEEKLKDKTTKYSDALNIIKETLKDKVADVKLTLNLKSYPACLTSKGDVSIEMEKVFNSLPNADKNVKAEKVLELNAEHEIVEKIYNISKTDNDLVKKYAVILYEQARLLEGLPIDDMKEFIQSINGVL